MNRPPPSPLTSELASPLTPLTPPDRAVDERDTRRIQVVHHTRYQYELPVAQSWQLAHLRPRQGGLQSLLSHSLEITPRPDWVDERADYFGNPVTAFAIHSPHDGLDVIARSTLDLAPAPPDSPAVMQPWRAAVLPPDARTAYELAQYLAPSPQVPRSRRASLYATRSFRSATPFLVALQDFAARIHRDFAFDASATTVTTPLAEVFERRRGVCQDFAQLMIAGLRGVGVPARYVSGYILTNPPPGKPRLIGADASHAWVSAWCAGQGWIDIDPTNGRRVDQDFVTLGWGRDFSDVTPLRGVILGGGEQELEARVTVSPLSA
jgi:transglutaminase-like putative cysteine protease